MELIARFHNKEAAESALKDFETKFSKNAIPDDMPEVTLEGELPLANLLKESGLVQTTSEAHRMTKQGAVRINGEKVDDSRQVIPANTTSVYQVGKRKFARVTIS
jgi:tyrosyl-tRNA synthetase